MSWLKIFTPERWRLVKILEVPCVWGATTTTKTHGKVFCYLYESNRTKRKFEVKSTFVGCPEHTVLEFFESTELYLTTVMLWMGGRKLPDIPTFDETPQEDFVNHMKS